MHIAVDGERGTTAYGHITRVLIDHYQHAGLSVGGPDEGTPSDVTATDNVLRGGWEIPTFQVGMWRAGGAVVHVTGNTIDGNRCGGEGCSNDPIDQGQGIGVLLLALPAGTTVEHNRLEGNDTGINLLASPSCCRISHNELVDNRYFGIVVQDGDASTIENRIRGGETGIAVVADAVDATGTSEHDRITGTTVAPIREIECCGYTATARSIR
jgi:parallel beta-helix repeat protein